MSFYGLLRTVYSSGCLSRLRFASTFVCVFSFVCLCAFVFFLFSIIISCQSLKSLKLLEFQYAS